MAELNLDNPYWQFGAYSNSDNVDYARYQDGKRIADTATNADILQADKNIDPKKVLAALSDASIQVQNQINGEPKSEAEITALIESGRLTLTPQGRMELDGALLDKEDVGYNVQKIWIDKLQDDIAVMNQLLERMHLLNTAVSENSDFIKNDTVTFEWNKPQSDLFVALKVNFSMNDAQLRTELKAINNDYYASLDIAGKSTAETGTYQFGTHQLQTTEFNLKFNKNDLDNAMEAVRNQVREKTKQTEVLAIDFQSTNERYSAVLTAMSKYAQQFYGTLNQLANG